MSLKILRLILILVLFLWRSNILNNLLDKTICLFINSFLFFIWIFFMLISNNIPTRIKNSDFIITLILIIISFIIYNLYIRQTKYIFFNFLFIFPSIILWFIAAKQCLKFSYHLYRTILSILGFLSTFGLEIQIPFIKFRKNN